MFFTSSCGDTFSSVKRGLTGAKKNTGDEFLIKKKDPLILPPDFENLPEPGNMSVENNEISIFEVTTESMTEESTSSSGSVEESILKKIRKR